MFITRVISDGGLMATDTGLRLDIRLPWYRSLPLSTVEIAEVVVDGAIVDRSKIIFELNGRRYSPAGLVDHPECWWFVLDSAYLDVSGYIVQPGSEHKVTVTVGIYPPYIPKFYRLTECSKDLIATASAGQGAAQ